MEVKLRVKTGWEKIDVALQRFVECAESDDWNASYEFWNGGFVRV